MGKLVQQWVKVGLWLYMIHYSTRYSTFYVALLYADEIAEISSLKYDHSMPLRQSLLNFLMSLCQRAIVTVSHTGGLCLLSICTRKVKYC